MMNRIKKRMHEARQRLTEGLARLAAVLRVAWASRQMRLRVGYYAALALLLVLLGSASWAWRARLQARRIEAAELPQAAVSIHAPALSPEVESTPEPVVWVRPLQGDVLAGYSPDAPVWSETLGQWQTHPALDIAGSPGEAVFACRDGTVAEAWSDRLWGNVVAIEHDEGYRSVYAGLNTLELVAVGDAVKAGQVIGSVGQSAACEAERGWHLHFELTRDGEPADFDALMPETTAAGDGEAER